MFDFIFKDTHMSILLPVTKCLCVFDPLKAFSDFLAASQMLFSLQVVQQEGGKLRNCRVKMKKNAPFGSAQI